VSVSTTAVQVLDIPASRQLRYGVDLWLDPNADAPVFVGFSSDITAAADSGAFCVYPGRVVPLPAALSCGNSVSIYAVKASGSANLSFMAW
jgi:hypothetical protein